VPLDDHLDEHGRDCKRHDRRRPPAQDAQASRDDELPHDLGFDAMRIIITMIGTAITPLRTAA
jgi:hypothetical protein